MAASGSGGMDELDPKSPSSSRIPENMNGPPLTAGLPMMPSSSSESLSTTGGIASYTSPLPLRLNTFKVASTPTLPSSEDEVCPLRYFAITSSADRSQFHTVRRLNSSFGPVALCGIIIIIGIISLDIDIHRPPLPRCDTSLNSCKGCGLDATTAENFMLISRCPLMYSEMEYWYPEPLLSLGVCRVRRRRVLGYWTWMPCSRSSVSFRSTSTACSLLKLSMLAAV